ncbi:MAG: pyrimidine/purine nucleoside phosphorylase, partial [Proteobacteria bacterium]|nr:pyrimidine/purine nucleoside phosphorylase [Pseudomonadota bacterium]
AVGEYTFGTDSIEVMTVVSGAMDIKLPDSDEWQTFQAGESFEVEKGVKFGVRVTTETSYLCLYK